MKKLQKPGNVSKFDQTVYMGRNQDSESMGFLNYEDQNHQNDIFFETSIRNQRTIFQSKTQNFERPWTLEDENKLIELHKQCGNKWTLIARHYPGMCENSIKNRFYSRLRKSIRKLNKVIGNLEIKNYNKFKLNIIFKLSNISQGKMAQKQKIVPQIFHFYREFLYNLIQFSDQNQNLTLSKQAFQNIQNIENLILPLVALENLFRLVRGQRVAKGKKKNIAYLRQFNFRLSLYNDSQMVITKENIFLLNSNQNHLLETALNQCFQEKRELRQVKKNQTLSETSISQYVEVKNRQFNQRKEFLDFQRSDSGLQSSIDLFKNQEEGDCKTQSSMWKDYLGHEMKEYDICGHEEISFEHEMNFALYTMKNSGIIEESGMW